MPYYIEGESETDFLKITKPEDIKLLDPACGSAHMLTYAFDLLTLIYEEEGYAPTEIPALILRHNLHGLEICPRAAQLAELALVFKAREKSRRFFQPEHLVRPRIIELRDLRFAENELRDYIHALGLGDLFNQPVLRLLHQFEEAKNFGSLIQPCLDDRAIAEVHRAIDAKDLDGQLFLRETHLKVLRVLEQAEALTQRYHILVANPPYMGGKAMNEALTVFAKKFYESARGDLMTIFLDRASTLSCVGARIAFVTLDSWMFLSSFENLRRRLLKSSRIDSLIHVGWNCFPHGHLYNRGIALTFVNCLVGPAGKYMDLSDVPATVDKESLFLKRKQTGESCFVVEQSGFENIPGSPIAFTVGRTLLNLFCNGRKLSDLGITRLGMTTANNAFFTRFWYEVGKDKLITSACNAADVSEFHKKWVPYNKGGAFRKWYGNLDVVVNWEHDGHAIKHYGELEGKIRSTVPNSDYYFRECITWSKVSSGSLAMRYRPKGSIFDVAGACVFGEMESLKLLLGFANSSVAAVCLKSLSPTINFEGGHIASLPIVDTSELRAAIVQSVATLIEQGKIDWDNFETSWDFRDQPLLRPGLKGATLEASWRNWEAQSTAAIRRMQELETENNRLFIAAYGLDGELQPEVPEEQITLARAEARRDMAAFLSYAVGCMMGRYGPDHPGLILADAGDSLKEYLAKVKRPLEKLTFAPDEDGIIPVLDGEWFEDDIVARTRDFLRATFGEATLNENIRFIEESLGKDLRKYFRSDFYKNHLQTYKKRPIYWLFRSPKGGFAALVYLHRMTRDTPNLVLNRYLRNYLVKLRARIEHLDHAQAVATTTKEKTAARKESEQLKKNLRECEDWERDVLLPLAQSRPAFDLDDGVKVNYLKLGDALATIPGLAAAEDE
jgi:hypothetical protein